MTPYVDLFGDDSDGDEIPRGQQHNMQKLFELAEELGSQGVVLEEEDLLDPPVVAPAPQPQPPSNQPPVFDIAALVAALKEATPPPPPPQPEMAQSLLIFRDHGVSPGRPRTKFSRPLEFVPIIHALLRVLKFSPPPSDSPPVEESEYSVFATASARSVEAPALWSHYGVDKKACEVDDRRVVKDAGSFGDSTLTRFFPLVDEDETLLKVLEVDAEVMEYIRSNYKVDWDPAKPFGAKPNTATKEAERFAKQDESTSALLARLSIYLQRAQRFISATIVSREKERAALLAGLPPPPMPECMVDKTLAGNVSLANYLTAAIGRIATRQKLEAGFDRRIRFLSAVLTENKDIVPMMARLRLRELPLTKGLLFAGQWTPTVESTTKTQLLSVSQAQLAREHPSTSKSSGDRFRIPFKNGRGSGGKPAKKD